MSSNAAEDRFIGQVGTSMSFEVGQWRVVDRLVRYLRRHLAAKLEIKAEGPDARTFVLRLARGKMVIYQWDTDDVAVLLTPGLEELSDKIRTQFGGSAEEKQRF